MSNRESDRAEHTARVGRWKKAIGWLATFGIIASIAVTIIVTVGTALIGWPWSDTQTREAYQAVLLLAVVLASAATIVTAAVIWGPLAPEESHE